MPASFKWMSRTNSDKKGINNLPKPAQGWLNSSPSTREIRHLSFRKGKQKWQSQWRVRILRVIWLYHRAFRATKLILKSYRSIQRADLVMICFQKVLTNKAAQSLILCTIDPITKSISRFRRSQTRPTLWEESMTTPARVVRKIPVYLKSKRWMIIFKINLSCISALPVFPSLIIVNRMTPLWATK